jgi:hypothetical protein
MTTYGALTEMKFAVFRFPRQETRKAFHLVPADLVAINVVGAAVAERP